MPDAPTDPTTLSVHFTDMAYGGDAVGRDPESGLAVFAWPAIKGERAAVAISERRKNLLRGVVAHVEEPSPLRASPPCPYFGACGGCQWQHITYEGQVQFKHDILRSQLERIGGIADAASLMKPPVASPRPFSYRNTSHFAVHPSSLALSYYMRDSHSLIPVATCPISNGGVNAALPVVNSLLGQTAGLPSLPDEPRGVMLLWKVVIRASEATGQIVVVFHTRAGGASRREQGAGRSGGRRGKGGRQVSQTAQPEIGPAIEPEPDANPAVFVRRRDVRRAIRSIGGPEPLPMSLVEVMDDGTVNLLGDTPSASSAVAEAQAEALTGSLVSRSESEQEHMRPPLGAWLERLAGRLYWVAPHSFFQVNTPAAELLVEQVAEHIPPRVGLLVDAHAGVGTFALAFAGRADRVIGFEMDGSAVASAQWTAASAGVTNLEFRRGRAEDLLARLPDTHRPDVVMLDPPRSGCHPRLLAEIARRQAPRIIYVSCDPSTLARDVKLLSQDYRLTSARVIDMFPQTFHLETVAVLDSFC